MNSVNAFVRSTIDDLVEKRLWPVAAVLLIALIAIPVLLSNPADEQPAPVSTAVTPAVGAGDALSAFQPAVSTEGKKSSEIRKQLEGFDTKDPFKPQNIGRWRKQQLGRLGRGPERRRHGRRRFHRPVHCRRSAAGHVRRRRCRRRLEHRHQRHAHAV